MKDYTPRPLSKRKLHPHCAVLLFSLFFPLFFYAVSPLQVVSGSGIVAEEDSKIYHFRYHNLADDYHLTGPSIWAVRFNFKGAYSVADSASFALNYFKIYNPYPNLEMRISLWNEQYGGTNELNYFPGSIIEGGNWQTVTLYSNPTNIVFPDVQNPLQIVWLVMEFTTPTEGKYMSASVGSGKNSFYYNTTVTGSEFWQSLFTAGYNCELRVSAIGNFNLLNTELELLSFSLPENILPYDTVYPSVTVYNHSNYPITDTLQVNITNPTQEFNQDLQIPLINIPAGDSLWVISSESVNFGRDPCQIKITLSLKHHPAVILAARYYNIFSETSSCHLIEYFRRYTYDIDDIPQDTDGLHHLLYFPNQVDDYSCPGAMQRFNFYQFNSLPQTAIDGYKRFYLPVEANSEPVLDAIAAAQEKRSFITRSNCRISILDPDNPENLRLSVTLNNDRTSLFEWTSSSAINPGFFAGIFEANRFEAGGLFYLKKWLAFNQPFSSTLDLGTSASIDLLVNTTELDSLKNYRVYYWIQNSFNNGGEIFYAKCLVFPYGWTVGIDDENLPHPHLTVHPNPLTKGNALKISAPNYPTIYTIYNLKGQKVFATQLVTKETSVPFTVFPASGIYFLRCETQVKDKIITESKKISVIK